MAITIVVEIVKVAAQIPGRNHYIDESIIIEIIEDAAARKTLQIQAQGCRGAKGEQAGIGVVGEQTVFLLTQPQQRQSLPDAEGDFPCVVRRLAAGGDEIVNKFKLFEGSLRLSGIDKVCAEFQAPLHFF